MAETEQAIDPETVEIANLEGVCMCGHGLIALIAPPMQGLTKERALVMAAWLVALADDGEQPAFGKILRRVLDT